jgi:peptidylprolyl isomerase
MPVWCAEGGTPSTQPPKEKGAKGAPAEAKVKLEPGDNIGTIVTNFGTIKVKLFPDIAPKAVENFKGLAGKKYYDNVIFHRIIDGFMIQGGDPKGTGTGGESIWGKPFGIETNPEYTFDRKGLLAMARTRNPVSNGSQFFITLGKCDWLNGQYTIFGEVIEGLDIVEKIGKVKKGPGDRPLEPVVMKSVRVEVVPDPKAPKGPKLEPGAAKDAKDAPPEGKVEGKVEPQSTGGAAK